MTPAAPSRRRKLAFAAVALLAFLGLLEVAGRLVELARPPNPVDIGAGFLPGSRVFVPKADDPAVLETAPEKRACFRTQEFALHKPPATLRVFVLGESSVNFLDDELAELEKDLWHAFQPRWQRVEVINVGGFSYGSERLRIAADEVLGYEPDALVVYMANNEIEEAAQRDLAGLGTATLQRVLSRSAAFRVVRDAAAARAEAKLRADLAKQRGVRGAEPIAPGAWFREFTQDELARRMTAFRENYAAILEACRARGVPVVVGTVPSNLVQPALLGPALQDYDRVSALLAAGRYEEASALGRSILAACPARHQSSDAENAIIRRLAQDFAVPLADAESVICAAEPHHVPGETLFRDHCHLTAPGNVLLRRTIADVLVAELRRRAAGGR